MPLFFFSAEKGGFDFSTLRKRGDYPLVNHKYPVFSGANIGIKPICLILFLMFAHLYRSHKRTQMMLQRYCFFLIYANFGA